MLKAEEKKLVRPQWKLNQNKQLLEPAAGGFHLDVNHPAGKAGEYLDEKAKKRARAMCV